jgi:hypothetical protein
MEKREKELASIKRLFIPNYIYGDNISVLNEVIKKVPLFTTLKRLFIELAPFLIVITVLIL